MGNGYPADWDRRRKKVYQRDGYQCQRCGASGGGSGNAELHAHHKVPKSKGGSHRLSNLTTLCSDCHSQVHGHAVGGNTSSGGYSSGSGGRAYTSVEDITSSSQRTGSDSGYSSDSISDAPILNFIFNWFIVYMLGAMPIMFVGMSIGFIPLPSWILALTAVSILTFSNGTTKSATIYTIYGIILCLALPLYVDSSYLFTFGGRTSLFHPVVLVPAGIVVVTNLLDFTASLIIGHHDHLPTRLT